MDSAEPRFYFLTMKSKLGRNLHRLFTAIRGCFTTKFMDTNQSTPDSQWDPNSLKSESPKKLSLNGTAAELRALEQTLALMNSGAQIPAEEAAQMKSVLRRQVIAGIPPKAEPTAPAVMERGPAPLRIMLTGRTGSGKDYIASRATGATVLHLDTPIHALIGRTFPGSTLTSPGVREVARTIWLWGKGQITDRIPLTIARLSFLQGLPEEWRERGFGQPDFWVNLLLSALEGSAPGRQIIIAGVDSGRDYNRLREYGFLHYHVMCSPSAYNMRPKDTTRGDQLAADLDQRVTKKISEQRDGPRVNCVWSDVTVPPSNRIYTADQWLKAIELAS